MSLLNKNIKDNKRFVDCTHYANRAGCIKLPCKMSPDAFVKLHEVSDGLPWGAPIEQALKAYAQALRCKANDRSNGQSVSFQTAFGGNLVGLMGCIERKRGGDIILLIGLIPNGTYK